MPIANFFISIVANSYRAILFLLLSSCGDSSGDGSEMNNGQSFLGGYEKNGEMTEEFRVSNTVLQMPRRYHVKSSTTANLNITVFWPGLYPDLTGTELDSKNRVNLIFQPNSSEPSEDDRNAALVRSVNDGDLSEPMFMEELGLYVYTDQWGAPILLMTTPVTEVDASRHVISCGGGAKWKERRIQCRVNSPFSEDIKLQYRFFTDLIPSWQALDSDVRSFAHSLVKEF